MKFARLTAVTSALFASPTYAYAASAVSPESATIPADQFAVHFIALFALSAVIHIVLLWIGINVILRMGASLGQVITAAMMAALGSFLLSLGMSKLFQFAPTAVLSFISNLYVLLLLTAFLFPVIAAWISYMVVFGSEKKRRAQLFIVAMGVVIGLMVISFILGKLGMYDGIKELLR